jgi:hypothetical protein
MLITVNFSQQPPLHIAIDHNAVGRRYFELVKSNYQRSRPIFRDELKYTTEYMHKLAHQAKQIFRWNWDQVDDFASGIGAQLHKDLEVLLANGFANIPEEHDELIHELHYCLHLIQHGQDHRKQRQGWFQIEWYNDEGFDLDSDFEFSPELRVGQVRLQNPFVGHGPWQLWVEQDFINISQTCKFHTFVKPGFNIAHSDKTFTEFDQLIEKIKIHAPEFVELHGVEKIRHYTGHPVIGQVTNVDDLLQVKRAPLLTLESLEFND